MLVCAIAVGEFAEGFSDPTDPSLQRMLACFEVTEIDMETSLIYAINARRLRQAGRLIGSNDLWIGCSAVRQGAPLVTRDARHLGRIENLRTIEY
jgi:predicted nucleic acid-binding protein